LDRAIDWSSDLALDSLLPRFDWSDYPSLRYLRQYTLCVLLHLQIHLLALHTVHDLRTNCARLQQLDEKGAEVHPLRISRRPNDLYEAYRLAGRDVVVTRDVDYDLLEILMFGCNGSERHLNPFGVQYSAPEYHFFEPRRLGQVDAS